MSRRMISETIIFDTEWLTEADFGSETFLTVKIDYQAYDTLKIIAPPDVLLEEGGVFQEFDVYKLENFGLLNQDLLIETTGGLFLFYHIKNEGLYFDLNKSYWETNLEGMSSIYIKGVKR